MQLLTSHMNAKSPCRTLARRGSALRVRPSLAQRLPVVSKKAVRFSECAEVSNKSDCAAAVLRAQRLGLAATGFFRFCTFGKRMLPNRAYVEMQSRRRGPLPGRSRPTDDSSRGQRMIQVTRSPFSFCSRESLGAPVKRAEPLPRTRAAFSGGPPRRQAGPRQRMVGEPKPEGPLKAEAEDRSSAGRG